MTAEIPDSTVALDILADTHSFLPITECTFLADKGSDVKNIYNQVKELYEDECIIPLNKRNTKIQDFCNGRKDRRCTKYIIIPDDLRLSIESSRRNFS